MAKSIRISESFHDWIITHNTAVETMEQTLQRLILDRGAAGGLARFSTEDGRRAIGAVAELRTNDAERLQALQDAP